MEKSVVPKEVLHMQVCLNYPRVSVRPGQVAALKSFVEICSSREFYTGSEKCPLGYSGIWRGEKFSIAGECVRRACTLLLPHLGRLNLTTELCLRVASNRIPLMSVTLSRSADLRENSRLSDSSLLQARSFHSITKFNKQ